MCNYWVFPISEDNLLICLKHRIIGLNRNNGKRARIIERGDHIIFYVSKAFCTRAQPKVREFQTVVECTGQPFKNAKTIWHASSGDQFPTSLPIKVVNRKKCPIDPLIKDLSFILSKKYWGAAFMGGVRKIPEDDFNLILKSME